MKIKWDERYSEDEYLFGTIPNSFLAEHFKSIPKGDVLCLADGEGRNSVFLAKQGYHVTAVDMSIIGINKAKKLAEENEVSIDFIHSNIKDYPIAENRWHGIVSIFFHIPVELREYLHRCVVNGLKNNGVFLLEAYTPNQLKHGTGGPSVVEILMTKEPLKQELKGLTFSHLAEIEREVQEGSAHAGWSSVVQVVANKEDE
jgi:2-polyprenyl-3-methyl-5-hydroxy-6-metoxy-1,4-benzoquinol methylase